MEELRFGPENSIAAIIDEVNPRIIATGQEVDQKCPLYYINSAKNSVFPKGLLTIKSNDAHLQEMFGKNYLVFHSSESDLKIVQTMENFLCDHARNSKKVQFKHSPLITERNYAESEERFTIKLRAGEFVNVVAVNSKGDESIPLTPIQARSYFYNPKAKFEMILRPSKYAPFVVNDTLTYKLQIELKQIKIYF